METISASLQRRLTSYGFVATVAAGAAATASGSIVYFDPVDITTPGAQGFGLAGIWFSMSTGQVQTTSFAGANFQLNFNTSTASRGVRNFPNGGAVGGPYANLLVRGTNAASAFLLGGSSAARLGAGVGVGPAGTFRNYFATLASNGGVYGNWNSLGSDYLGVRFDLAGTTVFGWVHIQINADYSITLLDFAYETGAGTPILTGAVPEPTLPSILLLGMGAAGLAAYRRRKAA